MNANSYTRSELKELANALKAGIYSSLAAEGLITVEQLSQLLEEVISNAGRE